MTSGAQAEAFSLAEAGADAVPERLESAMAGLVTAGVVETDRWSRRRVLQLGGAAAAATIAVVALPSVAAAASNEGGPGESTTGEVAVHIGLKDGNVGAVSPLAIPQSGTAYAHLYSSADRTSTPVASVAVSLPANQNYLEYSFAGVAPGNYM